MYETSHECWEPTSFRRHFQKLRAWQRQRTKVDSKKAGGQINIPGKTELQGTRKASGGRTVETDLAVAKGGRGEGAGEEGRGGGRKGGQECLEWWNSVPSRWWKWNALIGGGGRRWHQHYDNKVFASLPVKVSPVTTWHTQAERVCLTSCMRESFIYLWDITLNNTQIALLCCLDFITFLK